MAYVVLHWISYLHLMFLQSRKISPIIFQSIDRNRQLVNCPYVHCYLKSYNFSLSHWDLLCFFMLQDDVLENSTQKMAAKKTKLSSGTTVNTIRPSMTRLGDQNSFFVSSHNNNLHFLSVLYGFSLYVG